MFEGLAYGQGAFLVDELTRAAETLAKALQPSDIAEAILAVVKLSARVAVPELQVMPTLL